LGLSSFFSALFPAAIPVAPPPPQEPAETISSAEQRRSPLPRAAAAGDLLLLPNSLRFAGQRPDTITKQRLF
ncbi:hypothetical protein, partial [Klebsiella pneumoniae]|uniref:hypothetical protein n=1 Tax=Klebsiella pneumoniae TaxID=573 RepID=UPI002730381C